MDSQAKRNYRFELTRIDWDFSGEHGRDGFSGFHWYPARFVPQIPGILISYFTNPNDVVLDPFCGSGTTLIEAHKLGRKCIGIDINPIAVLMSKTKLLSYNSNGFNQYYNKIKKRIEIITEQVAVAPELNRLLDIPNYEENRMWYHKHTLTELGAIWSTILEYKRSKYHVVSLAAFSSILKSVNSQDKHWGWICDNVKPKTMKYKNAVKKFIHKLDEYAEYAAELIESSAQLHEEYVPMNQNSVIQGDCVTTLQQYPAKSIDMVMTSPPYLSMTDYIASQRLSYLWLDKDMMNIKTDEIGARYKRSRSQSLEQYISSMNSAFEQCYRVLKAKSFCCVVIGESPRHKPFLDEMISQLQRTGFKLHDILERSISRQRSLSPILHTETIQIYQKV